jgi:hypothetical protein
MRLFAILFLCLFPFQQSNPTILADQASVKKRGAQEQTSSLEKVKPTCEPQQDNPYDARKDTLYRWYLGITIVGVAGAWFGIVVLGYQTNIAMNAQRSWIVEKGVNAPEMTYDPHGWTKEIPCHFEVIGHSPVKVLAAQFKFRLVPSRPKDGVTEPDLPESPDYGEPFTISNIPQMAAIIPPGDKFTVSPHLEGLFIEQADDEAIKTGTKFPCVYGFIRYRDAFSKSKIRETRFCYVYGLKRNLVGEAVQPNQFLVGGPAAYNDVT